MNPTMTQDDYRYMKRRAKDADRLSQQSYQAGKAGLPMPEGGDVGAYEYGLEEHDAANRPAHTADAGPLWQRVTAAVLTAAVIVGVLCGLWLVGWHLSHPHITAARQQPSTAVSAACEKAALAHHWQKLTVPSPGNGQPEPIICGLP